MFLELLLILAGLLYSLHLYISWNWDVFLKKKIPYMKPTPFFGNFKDRFLMTKTFYDFDLNTYNYFKGHRFGGYFEGSVPGLVITDPELIRSILVKDFDYFSDRRTFTTDNDPYSNEMVFNKQGQEWRDLRALLTPAFSSGKMKKIFEHNVKKSALNSIKYVEDQNGGPIEMKNFFGRYAMEIVASSAFGFECKAFESEDNPFVKMAQRIFYPGGLAAFKFAFMFALPALANKLRFSFLDQESLTFFESIMYDNIRQREQEGVRGNDFLQLLLDTKNNGPLEDDDQEEKKSDNAATLRMGKHNPIELNNTKILAQALLFFFAGYETSSSFLTFTAYELAVNPEIQEKLYEEIRDAVDKSNDKGDITYEALQQMEYMDMVMIESQRKHPVITRLERQCAKEYTITDTNITIDKGTFILIPVVGFNTDPDLYDHPERFDPERYSKEEKAKRNPYLTMAFGAGPRNCFGMRFALMNAKASLSYLLYNYKLCTCDKTQIPMKYSKETDILRPEKGMWLVLEKRQ